MNDDVFTIDPLATQSLDHLGPANAEQRAERKEQRRTERRESWRLGTDLSFEALAVAQAYLGALPEPEEGTR